MIWFDRQPPDCDPRAFLQGFLPENPVPPFRVKRHPADGYSDSLAQGRAGLIHLTDILKYCQFLAAGHGSVLLLLFQFTSSAPLMNSRTYTGAPTEKNCGASGCIAATVGYSGNTGRKRKTAAAALCGRSVWVEVPKGTDFTGITEDDTLWVQRWVNEYPRGILGGRCAARVLMELAQEAGVERVELLL